MVVWRSLDDECVYDYDYNYEEMDLDLGVDWWWWCCLSWWLSGLVTFMFSLLFCFGGHVFFVKEFLFLFFLEGPKFCDGVDQY